MKSQAIPRAMLLVCFCALAFAMTAAAADAERSGTHRLATAVKSSATVTVVSDVEPGNPQLQYGDPDDLGGGDQNGGELKPPRDPDGNIVGYGGVIDGWMSALGELLMRVLSL